MQTHYSSDLHTYISNLIISNMGIPVFTDTINGFTVSRSDCEELVLYLEANINYGHYSNILPDPVSSTVSSILNTLVN